MEDFWNNINCGSNIQEVIKQDDCIVLRAQDESGEGIMTCYEVFPGAMIMFNDFHMGSFVSEFHTSANLLCIDHCREGCIEQQVTENAYSYLEQGNLRVDCRTYHSGKVSFPQNHYHGISIGFHLPKAQDALKNEIRDFPVNLNKLIEKFCKNQKPYVIRSQPEILHIFSELYHVPQSIKKDYFRIKLFELLLYLNALEFNNYKEERPYFYKGQVEKIKAVRQLMIQDLTKYYTIPELADRFNISESALKNCFKTVYGSPIFAYMKNYRMNTAASMLKTRQEKSVTEIAAEAGYDSPSKFSAAFRKTIGMTPLEYRKSKD